VLRVAGDRFPHRRSVAFAHDAVMFGSRAVSTSYSLVRLPHVFYCFYNSHGASVKICDFANKFSSPD
jgi:hypothetical protein